MFWYALKVAIISLFIILLSHHIMDFLKNKLTNEKIIDCVKSPQKEYDKINEILENPINDNQNKEIIDSMKEELSNHIKDIFNN